MTNIIVIITTIKNIVIITMTNNGSVAQCQLYWHHHQSWQLTLAVHSHYHSQMETFIIVHRWKLSLHYCPQMENYHHCPQMETFITLSYTDGHFCHCIIRHHHHCIIIHRWKLSSL